MREAFEEEGIEFAHRNVTVYIPPDTQHDASTSENHADKLQQVAAAAALITEQEQTEEMDKKK
jgi:hypothetical protein